MLFENYYNRAFKNRIQTILIISYLSIIIILYFSGIITARHNALLWVKADMQKKLETFLSSVDEDFSRKTADIASFAENNSLIAPLSLGTSYQLSEFINSKKNQAKKGLTSIIILDRNNHIVFNNTRSFGSLTGIPTNMASNSFFLYNGKLFRIYTARVYYEDPLPNRPKASVGVVFGIYDFLDLAKAGTNSLRETGYRIFGCFDNSLAFTCSNDKVFYSSSLINPNSRNKFIAGYTYLTINGEHTFVLIKNIPLANKNKTYQFMIAVPPNQYAGIEFSHIISTLKSCTFTILLITIILGLVIIILKNYIDKEFRNRLEIQELHVQRHDYSKHISVIAGMIDAGEYDELKAYTGSLGKRAAFTGDLFKLGSPAVSILIQEKLLLAHQNQIKFELNVRTGLPKMRLDPSDLCTVLSNILDNAMEASLSIEVPDRLVSLDAGLNGRYFEFRISNSGLPIPEENLGKIFKPGFSTKKDKIGHGMGLYIVKRVLKKYNGCIEVESNDTTTSFTVFFPIKEK